MQVAESAIHQIKIIKITKIFFSKDKLIDMSFPENCLYRFVSAMKDNMVLDVSQNPKDYNKAIVYQWNDGSNQKFAIRSVGKGKYAIFCAKNNMVLTPEKESPENGARIVVTKGLKMPHQFWEFEASHLTKQGRPGYILKSFSGRALDICSARCQNDQSIIQWDIHRNKNQVWFIQPV